MFNTSKVQDAHTANTHAECAQQRAEHLFSLGVRSVLELCVGPSLFTLEQAYKKYNIKVVGNDIEKRWQDYYPQGEWRIGNALTLDCSGVDAVVFAPPLSKGCTGKRNDALSIDAVFPRYHDYLLNLDTNLITVLVLPARSQATRQDRKQYYKLLNDINTMGLSVESIPLTAGRRRITKYIDLYLRKK